MAVPELKISLGVNVTDFDAGLKKAQDSVAKFAQAAEATGGGIGGTFEKAGDTMRDSFRRAASSAITAVSSLVSPASLATAGVLALGAAITSYFATLTDKGPQIDEALKTHGELIKSLKAAYGEALVGLEQYTAESENSFRNRIGASITLLQTQLQGLGNAFAGQFGTVVQNEIFGLDGSLQQLGGTVIQLPAKLEPFRKAFEDFQQSVRAGNPDFVTFKNEVDRIGAAAAGTNPEVNKTAVALAEAAKQGYQAQQGVGAARDAMSQLAPEARKAAEAVNAYNAAIKGMGEIAPVKKTDRFKADESYLDAIFNAKGDENKIRLAVQARNDAIARITAEEAEKNKGAKTTDNTDYELEAEKERLTMKLDMLRNHLMSKDELMQANFVKNQELVNEAASKEVISEQQKLALLEQLNADHYAKLEAMREATNMKAIQSTGDMFGSLQQITESWGKKNSAMSKAFGIAQALISTYVGATKALELPFPANLAAFAAVMAKGLAAVAAITAVNTSGKGGNSARPVGGGSGSGGGAAQQAAPAQAGRDMYVSIQGDIFNREMVRGLLQKVQEFQKDGGGKVIFA